METLLFVNLLKHKLLYHQLYTNKTNLFILIFHSIITKSILFSYLIRVVTVFSTLCVCVHVCVYVFACMSVCVRVHAHICLCDISMKI